MNIDIIAEVGLGFIAFSMIASSIYILNDYRDIESDKLHPKKKERPMASGKVSKSAGLAAMIICLVSALAISYFLDFTFFIIIITYFLLNNAYSFGLKNISILDIFIIAIGFILRVKSGGEIADVVITRWLIVMVFLLAVFLGLAKRRDDILLKISSGLDMRKSIKGYNLEFVNSAIVMISGIIIVAYQMYTFTPMAEQQFTYRVYYTSVFVIAGILRYLQLVFVQNDTGSPTSLLYKDRFIQVTMLMWGISFIILIYFPNLWGLL